MGRRGAGRGVRSRREQAMCTEKLTRRGALVGGAAVAVSAALAGTAQAEEREPAAFSGRRHGLRDLTHELKTSIPAFAPGEEPKRETVATIEDDGYYMQKWDHHRAHRDPRRRARAFHPGGPAGPRPGAVGADHPGGGRRHRRPGGPGPGHGRDRRRPPRLRAPPRPHPARLGRPHELRLGGQGGRRRRLPRPDAGRHPALPRLRRRGHRVAAAPPGHPQPGVDTLSIDPETPRRSTPT